MQGYTYKTGDRPLEGYTIQRGVGRGALGEVYYAVSDSGREVALKCIIGYEQIELRGVTQCMNLKNPHLVSIFDVRQNAQGQSFVIMEYVAGPSLRDLLNDAPSGLGPQKTAFFLRELAKGLSYLHDRGIVHRDLKPGNIFYEDGYVKIGDYGLSKSMTPSQHSGQTITVGTVHYMAPEIGQGRYDKSIDIYAMGVLVYEMLTGHVPFFGASHGEILMKHLVETPDVTGLDEPFATVIRKAMAKAPDDRYATVQEMVEAVFGAEHISQSVSVFQPDSLSVVAERVGAKMVTVGGPGSSAELPASLGTDPDFRARGASDADVVRARSASEGALPAAGSSDAWAEFGQRLDRAVDRIGTAKERILASRDRFRDRIGMSRDGDAGDDLRDTAAVVDPPGGGPPGSPATNSSDVMTNRQRLSVATVATVIIAIATSALEPRTPGGAVLVVASILGGVLGLKRVHAHLLASPENGRASRILYAPPAFLGVLLLSMAVMFVQTWLWHSFALNTLDPTGVYVSIAVTLFVLRWDKVLHPGRRNRVVLAHVLKAALLAYIVGSFLGGDMPVLATGIMAGISLVAQVTAPFIPGSARGRPRSRWPIATRTTPRPQLNRPAATKPGIGMAPQKGTDLPGSPTVTSQARRPSPVRMVPGQRVPAGLKVLWFLLMIAGMGTSLFGFIMAVTENRHVASCEFACVAMIGGAGFLFCIRQLYRRSFVGWWTNLIRPMIGLPLLAITVGCFMGICTMPLHGDDAAMFAFFTVFPAMMLIVLACITQTTINGLFGTRAARMGLQVDPSTPSTYLRQTALLLTCLGFIGPCGMQRFYVGKFGTGLLWLCTFGLGGIGQIFDLIMICVGEFKDKDGRRLTAWQNLNELRTNSGQQPTGRGHSVPVPAEPASSPPGSQSPALTTGPAAAALDVESEPTWNDLDIPPAQQVGAAIARPSLTVSRWTRLPVAGIAYALMIFGMLIGITGVLQFPSFVQAGIPSPRMAAELDEFFQEPGWPQLVSRLLVMISAVSICASGLLLFILRNRARVAHCMRAILGTVGVLGAGSLAYDPFRGMDWHAIHIHVYQHNYTRVFTMAMFKAVGPVTLAIIVLLVSLAVLAWPDRKRQTNEARQGVAA